MSCVQHCWHSTHTGPWMGVNPPPMVCCHCGRSPESLHGPYNPNQGGTAGGVTWSGTTVEVSATSGPVKSGKILLTDTNFTPGRPMTGNGGHGPHVKSQLNG